MSTKEKTKKKGKAGKIILKVLCVFLCVLVAFIGITTVVSVVGDKANTQKAQSFEQVKKDDTIVPEKDEDGNWTFTTDRDFKVLQLTDVHIGGGWMSLKKDAMALNAVAAMVTAEKPDLVVVTGDMAYPVPFQAGTFNNKASAKIFASLMEQLGVYWTVAFGNHDTELYSYYSREKIADFYENSGFKYCIFTSGPEDVDGSCNQLINVKNTKGEITQSLYVFDSHSYTDGDFLGIMWKYDNIHENQVEWYKESVLAIDAANKALDPTCPMFSSLMFFHIPLKEYEDAWKEYKANGSKDTENVKYLGGGYYEDNEKVCCGVGDDNLFETIVELGSTKGIFCGHDHVNNAQLEYKGIRLVYGMSIDYLAYLGIDKKGAQRGCTVISIDENGNLSVSLESYYQDKYVSKYEKEKVSLDR